MLGLLEGGTGLQHLRRRRGIFGSHGLRSRERWKYQSVNQQTLQDVRVCSMPHSCRFQVHGLHFKIHMQTLACEKSGTQGSTNIHIKEVALLETKSCQNASKRSTSHNWIWNVQTYGSQMAALMAGSMMIYVALSENYGKVPQSQFEAMDFSSASHWDGHGHCSPAHLQQHLEHLDNVANVIGCNALQLSPKRREDWPWSLWSLWPLNHAEHDNLHDHWIRFFLNQGSTSFPDCFEF